MTDPDNNELPVIFDFRMSNKHGLELRYTIRSASTPRMLADENREHIFYSTVHIEGESTPLHNTLHSRWETAFGTLAEFAKYWHNEDIRTLRKARNEYQF